MSSFVCRVCLATNARMLHIDRQLEKIYENLTSSKLDSGDGRPQTACYICVSQLQRSRALADMARHSETVLTRLLLNGIDIKTCEVSALNPGHCHLTVTDVIHTTHSIPDHSTSDHSTLDKFKRTCQVTVKQEPMKEEPPELDDSTSVDGSEMSLNLKKILANEQHDTEPNDCFYCDTCKIKFTRKINLVSHLHLCVSSLKRQNHTGDKPYNSHIHTTHSIPDQLFNRTCQVTVKQEPMKEEPPELDDSTSVDGSEMSLNMEKILTNEQHDTEPNDNDCFYCDTCKMKFTRKINLISHLHQSDSCSKRHNHTGDKPYACNQCDKAFTQASILKRHIRTHTGEKPYVCCKCNKGFSQSGTLKLHMRTHTLVKPYACNECNKGFSQATHLKRHMKTHTGEKPYTCNECNKGFSLASTLKRHIRTHTGEKPYVCNECNKGFSQATHLKSHMRIHTREKPYACTKCNMGFSRAGTFKLHMQNHTGEKP